MSVRRKSPEQLRSHRWYAAPGHAGAHKRRRMLQMGFTEQDYGKKPIIAVITTWSDFATCHTHFPQRVEEVKRGIWQAGGFPAVLPALSLSETYVRPSAMMYRNLLAMETEELLRSHPVDGAVLLGGCDKTTPGLLMGALSMNIPVIYLPAGAMVRGNWRGQVLGAGTTTWKVLADYRAGRINDKEYQEINEGTERSTGTCNTMGTASTMTSLVDVMGLTLPGASSIPAVDMAHARMASTAGRRIVEMVWEDLKPSDIVTSAAVANAVVTDMALSGSTNSLIHLTAMARRAGVALDLDAFDRASERVPVLCDLAPSGKYLMEDFYFAGGLLGFLSRIKHELDLNCVTVTGKTLGQNLEGASVWNDDVIRPLDNPLFAAGGLVVLRGNLAPRGAVLKRAAADPRLLQHTGAAVVFENYADMMARIDDPDLPVTADSVLVLRDAGPVGAPGMPEWGMLPIPKKLLQQGVTDMLRLSDARMSGTSFGACVLHICPESRVGGPLGLVRNGDLIRLDTHGRRLDVLLDESELAARRGALKVPVPRFERGYGTLFSDRVLQADEGCDFDFLARPGVTPEPEIS